MELQTKSQVLDALIAQLVALPWPHPERGPLIRMIIDLARQIERQSAASPAQGDC